MGDLVERLEQTTLEMANRCSVPMELWDRHSNAALEAAATITALRDRVAEVERQLAQATDPEYLAGALEKIGVCDIARATAAEAAIARLRDALEPFAADTLPNSRKIRIAYNRHGLRCAMSDLDIARDNALRALNRDTHHETR